MQIVKWNGNGNGTLTSPFILEVNSDFDPKLPFDINLLVNYINPKPEYSYFKFDNSITIYLLAFLDLSVAGKLSYKSEKAIETTIFLSEAVDTLDGPFVTATNNSTNFILKQQVFNPQIINRNSNSVYLGDWNSEIYYEVGNLVAHEGNLYICRIRHSSSIFEHTFWQNVSSQNIIEMERNPLQADYNYSIGTIWINTLTLVNWMLIKNDERIALWQINNIVPDNVTLNLNEESKLQIKDRTVDGGDWS